MLRRKEGVKKMKRFFRRHWKKLLVVLIVIITVIFAIVLISNLVGNRAQNTGISGMLEIDGKGVGVFEEKAEAESNTYTVEAKTSVLEIRSSESTNISVSKSGFPFKVNQLKNEKYELDLTNLAHDSIITVKLEIGGDGTFVSRRLTNEVSTYYLCLKVDNPSSETEAKNDVPETPSGTVTFNGEAFKTYGSESAAQQAVQGQNFVIPKGMANNLVLTAEPTEGTARIWGWVCMAGGEDVYDDGQQIRMNADSNWSAAFDVSAYSGKQIVICLKAEDGMGLNNGYSYVSFVIPELN